MTDPAGDLPSLHVGDHVLDRDEDDGATLVVTGLPLQRAATYDVDIGDADDDVTIATLNPEYPTEDLVIEAVYPDRTDVYLDDQQTYAFPRSRLKLETPIHDRGEDESEENTDDERVEPSRSEPADFGGGESTGVQDL